MSRIVDSKNMDLSGYEPVERGEGQDVRLAPPPSQQAPSSMMVSSLPGIAAGQDLLARQFYERNNVPRRRIFQVTE